MQHIRGYYHLLTSTLVNLILNYDLHLPVCSTAAPKMGRKRKKRQWRKSESTEQINAALREASKASTVKATVDDELFFVDDKTTRVKPVVDEKEVTKHKTKKRKRPAPVGNRHKKKAIKSVHTQVGKFLPL